MKILVIDPNPLFLRVVYNFIGALPSCECAVAASITEALHLAETREADVVLISYSLRGSAAEHSAPRLRELAPAAQVLLLTEDAATYHDSCLAAEADGCLAKDTFGRDLARLVTGHAANFGKECA
jgi:DNA-binding NarL/FixJ family response regulator